jgi:hypothetical protein
MAYDFFWTTPAVRATFRNLPVLEFSTHYFFKKYESPASFS